MLTVACKVEFEPTGTEPKFKLAGVIENAGAVPVPCTEYTVGEPAALCVNVKLALIRPAASGANVTSNTWLPPGVIVTGKVFGVNVNCPSDDVIPDIIRSTVPVLLTVACKVEFEPTGTDPKFKLAGVIDNAGAIPVPCIEYTVGEPAALCVNVKLALTRPAASGANVTSNTWLPPGVIVIGKVFGVNVNCPSDDVIPDIIRSAVPVLLTVACNVVFEPTGTDPKFKLAGVIDNAGAIPVPCTRINCW